MNRRQSLFRCKKFLMAVKKLSFPINFFIRKVFLTEKKDKSILKKNRIKDPDLSKQQAASNKTTLSLTDIKKGGNKYNGVKLFKKLFSPGQI